MKRLVLVCAIAALAAGCGTERIADESSGPTTCEAISRIAAAIMVMRQHGSQQADMLRDSAGDTPDQVLIRGLIDLAFDHPQAGTAAGKERAVDEYRALAMKNCLEEEPR